MSKIWKDKNFIKSMINIALPITLQNLIASSVNMLDTLMITSLGQASLAAVGLANQVFFFYSVTIFGVATGSAVFVAQFWGRQDYKNIKKILGLCLTITSVIGLFFTLAALITPEGIMTIFSEDPEVIKLGVDYLIIVAFSYIITGISFSYAVASRSIGDAKMPMVVSIVSFIINGIFNYLLIFGKFGFPRLGVKGAAYGTLIARVVELGLILYTIYSSSSPLAANIKELTNWNKNFIQKYAKTAYPVIVNEALWSLGTVLYSIAYAKIGTEAAAAVQILNTVQNIFMVITRGVGNACTVMVGNKIGANEEEMAIEYANRFLKISVALGLVLATGLYLTSDIILSLFRNLTPQLYTTSKKLLNILALFFTIKVFNGTVIVGVLRGGGDTKFSMLLEMGSVWLVGVPLAFLGAIVFKLPVYLVTPLVYSEEIVKALFALPRLISKKWVTNVIKDM
ncbi:MATE family efflux transporter [Tepidimicrobium xylanilyticum]|uniref:Putative efflux protein, MATE family n=1 Tax=Tepidimicrobium xylanilyticum TaxID=1123352 RepID=A0A1H3A4X9_9FIRM|nr:MATE family efflux transporter [Tepidimicrobium xylanilyticum]GMG96315.1 MATE family efflux transporter [Tepidimicrobium xylanilyticum]SDX24696.1 putative efflux protein, MATE family [Tepidimicrobium xylanilyticum]